MATVALVLGGTAGFLVATVCLLVFGISALHALVLWSASGMLIAAVLMLVRRGARTSTPGLEPAQI